MTRQKGRSNVPPRFWPYLYIGIKQRIAVYMDMVAPNCVGVHLEKLST
ncbi:protein of unknown function [Pseudodesulfovibrio profundus]|uniref:Uncharacterized protein n=1 Tax=Pseudodesulfovibrio profundus TaxID=57320 RepID=A0A2C8F3X8_9BACT|nr:protein of unknown function [Pseudodesulfovibrio profundus]